MLLREPASEGQRLGEREHIGLFLWKGYCVARVGKNRGQFIRGENYNENVIRLMT